MPSGFKSQPYRQLNLGLNLRGAVGGINLMPGEATHAMDVRLLEDGSFEKHWGWVRKNPSAVTGRPLGMKAFTYRGKNADAGGGETARPGNYGIADDSGAADYTKRGALYSGCIVLTDSTFYRWDAASESFVSVSLPSTAETVSVAPQPKPSFVVYNDNVYICGWADFNLRYDPTDEKLYLWGWRSPPTATSFLAAGPGGGSLIEGGVYRYGYSYVNLYTGEESAIGPIENITVTSSNEVRVTITQTSAAAVADYAFNALATNQDTDIGAVLYRSESDRNQLNFLALIKPSSFSGGTATYDDDGDATEASIHPYVLPEGITQLDINGPTFNFFTEFRDQFYGVSYKNEDPDRKQPSNANRVWWNSFDYENSFVERYVPLDYRHLPLPEGEILTAIHSDDTALIIFTQKGAYAMTASPNYSSGSVNRAHNRLPWTVGCVGPKAVCSANGWLYFMSERGPYRWRSGLSDPQWISKNLIPMFLDQGGLCQLNPGLMNESECAFDPDANVIRWAFAVGSSTSLNRHLTYWCDGDKYLPAPEYGWVLMSPKAQCFEKTLALAGLNADGTPPSPETRRERMVFADANGYVYEFQPGARRAGLPSGSIATGSVISATATTATVTTAADPLLTQNDGLKGMFVEMVHSDGTREVQEIFSNTTTAITISGVWDQVPTTSSTWYVGGVQAHWRSWPDSVGYPHDRKTLLHLYASYESYTPAAGPVLDVTVRSGDRNMATTRSRTASLDDFNEKMLVSRTGLFFDYEFANTKPDQHFVLRAIEPEFAVLGQKRKE